MLRTFFHNIRKNFVNFGPILYHGSNFKVEIYSVLQSVAFCPTILLPKGMLLASICTMSGHMTTHIHPINVYAPHQSKTSQTSKFHSKWISKHHHYAYLDRVLKREWLNCHTSQSENLEIYKIRIKSCTLVISI